MNELEVSNPPDKESDNDLEDNGLEEELDLERARLDKIYQQAIDAQTPGNIGTFCPDGTPDELSEILDNALYLQLQAA